MTRAGFPFEAGRKLFLNHCEQLVREGNLSPSTYASYRAYLNNLSKAFRGKDLNGLTRAAIEGNKHERLKNGKVTALRKMGGELKEIPLKPITPATVNRELATLKRMFAVLVELEHMKSNPAEKVRLVKENNRRERYLTQEEIDRLLKECKSRHLCMAVLIALNTGLRLHDCLTLRWEEIDLKRNEIKKTVKRGKEVRIPLTKRLRAALLENPGISGYVLPSTRRSGEPFRVDSNIGFETACRRAGITDFRFHDLRHTFATWVITRTRDINTCAQMLGHGTTRMTERYSHLVDEHARDQMRKFEGGRQPIRVLSGGSGGNS